MYSIYSIFRVNILADVTSSTVLCMLRAGPCKPYKMCMYALSCFAATFAARVPPLPGAGMRRSRYVQRNSGREGRGKEAEILRFGVTNRRSEDDLQVVGNGKSRTLAWNTPFNERTVPFSESEQCLFLRNEFFSRNNQFVYVKRLMTVCIRVN